MLMLRIRELLYLEEINLVATRVIFWLTIWNKQTIKGVRRYRQVCKRDNLEAQTATSANRKRGSSSASYGV